MIILKLDTAAVASLFPEGSEARIDLQKAVIANIVDRISQTQALKVSGEFGETIRQAASQSARETIKEYLERPDSWYQRPDLSDAQLAGSVKTRIKALIGNEIEGHLREMVGQNATETTRRLIETIGGKIEQEVERKASSLLDAHIQNAVSARFRSAMDAANKLAE